MNKTLKKSIKNISLGGWLFGDYIVESPVNFRGYSSIEEILDGRVADAINYFIVFSVVVAVGLIIYAGYMFITAAGDPEKIEKGQKSITAAIIGLVIVFLARIVVLYFIEKIMGV